MFRDKERKNLDPTIVVRTTEKTFNAALNWKEPKKIFTNSWSDFFIREADGWRDEAWDVIRRTPQHTWQILTKRPERIMECLPSDWGSGWDNVWLGTSTENQDTYNEREEIMRYIPASLKFVSAEPLLSDIDMRVGLGTTFDWIIVGGESGNETGKYRYRACELDWIRSIVNQCKERNVPVFVKQLGTALAKAYGYENKAGADMTEWEFSDISFQEFPERCYEVV